MLYLPFSDTTNPYIWYLAESQIPDSNRDVYEKDRWETAVCHLLFAALTTGQKINAAL